MKQDDVSAFQSIQRAVHLLRVDLNVDLREGGELVAGATIQYEADNPGIGFLLDPRLQLRDTSIDGSPANSTRMGPLVQVNSGDGKHSLSADWSGNLASHEDLGIHGSSFDLNANVLWFPTLVWGSRFDASLMLKVPEGSKTYFPSVARTAGQSTSLNSVIDVPLVGGIERGSSEDSGLSVHSLVREDATPLLRTARGVFDWLRERWGPPPFRPINIVETWRRKRGAYAREGLIVCPDWSTTAEQEIAQRLVHEATHQWWGMDALPGERWFTDDWLSEGLATFAEYLWVRDREGDDAAGRFLTNASQRVKGIHGSLASSSMWSEEGWNLSRSGAVLVLAAIEGRVPELVPVLRRYRDERSGAFVSTQTLIDELSNRVPISWMADHIIHPRDWPGDLVPSAT